MLRVIWAANCPAAHDPQTHVLAFLAHTSDQAPNHSYAFARLESWREVDNPARPSQESAELCKTTLYEHQNDSPQGKSGAKVWLSE